MIETNGYLQYENMFDIMGRTDILFQLCFLKNYRKKAFYMRRYLKCSKKITGLNLNLN